MITGYLVSSVALAALVLLEPGSSRVLCALLGIGGGIALTPTNAGRQTGTSLGIALLGTLFASLGTGDLVRSLTAAGITDPRPRARVSVPCGSRRCTAAPSSAGCTWQCSSPVSLAATAIAVAVKAGRPRE
ncbi:hypothetical protein ABJI51_40515 [Amycolatopsis sp. NEAU-NG30]|uniref:Uncharacterized protein n=1 Tax=Amycolatopsis melonis TaxID=3156488 RepID=A0ABV0LSW5_9PSEU